MSSCTQPRTVRQPGQSGRCAMELLREEPLAPLGPRHGGARLPHHRVLKDSVKPGAQFTLPGSLGKQGNPGSLWRTRSWALQLASPCALLATHPHPARLHMAGSLWSLPANTNLQSVHGVSFFLLKNHWILGVGLPVTETLATSPCQTSTSETLSRKTETFALFLNFHLCSANINWFSRLKFKYFLSLRQLKATAAAFISSSEKAIRDLVRSVQKKMFSFTRIFMRTLIDSNTQC